MQKGGAAYLSHWYGTPPLRNLMANANVCLDYGSRRAGRDSVVTVTLSATRINGTGAGAVGLPSRAIHHSVLRSENRKW